MLPERESRNAAEAACTTTGFDASPLLNRNSSADETRRWAAARWSTQNYDGCSTAVTRTAARRASERASEATMIARKYSLGWDAGRARMPACTSNRFFRLAESIMASCDARTDEAVPPPPLDWPLTGFNTCLVHQRRRHPTGHAWTGITPAPDGHRSNIAATNATRSLAEYHSSFTHSQCQPLACLATYLLHRKISKPIETYVTHDIKQLKQIKVEKNINSTGNKIKQ